MTVTEDKIEALMKAAGVNAEPFWPGLSAKLWPVSTWGASSAMWGLVDLPPAAGTPPAGNPAPATTAAPAEEKKVEAKKEESEESDDDTGFGLFD